MIGQANLRVCDHQDAHRWSLAGGRKAVFDIGQPVDGLPGPDALLGPDAADQCRAAHPGELLPDTGPVRGRQPTGAGIDHQPIDLGDRGVTRFIDHIQQHRADAVAGDAAPRAPVDRPRSIRVASPTPSGAVSAYRVSRVGLRRPASSSDSVPLPSPARRANSDSDNPAARRSAVIRRPTSAGTAGSRFHRMSSRHGDDRVIAFCIWNDRYQARIQMALDQPTLDESAPRVASASDRPSWPASSPPSSASPVRSPSYWPACALSARAPTRPRRDCSCSA